MIHLRNMALRIFLLEYFFLPQLILSKYDQLSGLWFNASKKRGEKKRKLSKVRLLGSGELVFPDWLVAANH